MTDDSFRDELERRLAGALDFTPDDLPADCLCWSNITEGGVRYTRWHADPECRAHDRFRAARLVVGRGAEAAPVASWTSASFRPAPQPTPRPQPAKVDRWVDVMDAAQAIHDARGHTWTLERCHACIDRAHIDRSV
jgi:hypothetical protein